ncbi:MAG: DUF2141 domain-containing protein [Rhodospirillales bacterium]
MRWPANGVAALAVLCWATVGNSGEPTDQALVTLVIEGLEEPTGRVEWAVFAKAENFPIEDRKLMGGGVDAAPDSVRVTLPPLAPGRYAFVAFHDANGNGKFDQGLMGVPLESFGFSRGARPLFSAPPFEAAALDLGPGPATVQMRLSR